MTSKVYLVSNFRDYYDHHFSIEGDARRFHRNSTAIYSKLEQLTILKAFELRPPHFGVIRKDIVHSRKVVVYLDEYAHRGEGKIVVGKTEALNYDGKTFASYIEDETPGNVHHIRYLRFGSRWFWLHYQQLDSKEWRSNVGDVKVCRLDEKDVSYYTNYREIVPFLHTFTGLFPMIAVDFLVDKHFQLCGIDINTSPQIKGTTVEDVVKPTEIVDEIVEFFDRNPNFVDSQVSLVRLAREAGCC
jgi:hypothetical protein